MEEIATFYKLSSSLDLLYEIAVKKIDLKELKEFTVHGDKVIRTQNQNKPVEEKPEYQELKPGKKEKDAELIIFGESSDRIMYTLANCCKPIPGDDVFGFITPVKD
jgi:guanosine-3',5'-bis(diphosphate) 3'-pyrophosphohydrolase